MLYSAHLSLQKAGHVCFLASRKELLRLINPRDQVKASPFSLFSGVTLTFSREAGAWESWYSYLENCLVGYVYLKVKSGPSQMVKLKLHFGTWKMPFYSVLPLPSQKSSVALFFT